MTNPLSKKVIEELDARGVERTAISVFRESRPQPLLPIAAVARDVEETFHSCGIPEDLLKSVKTNYLHSTRITDPVLVSRGYTVLCEKPLIEADYDTFEDMFIRAAMSMPHLGSRPRPKKCDDAAMMNQVQNDRSAGLLPLNVMHGSAVGTKNQMHESAVLCNVAAVMKSDTLPGLMPYKASAKHEVLKRNKKIRVILGESMANKLVLEHYFGNIVMRERDIPSGNAIGMSTMNGDYKVIVASWYDVYLKHHKPVDWNAFLDILSTYDINESDKTAWESSTNEVDGLVQLIQMNMRNDYRKIDEKSKKLLARALADYMNPAIQIEGDGVYFAPWRIPSGSFFTAYGNTERHMKMNFWVCDYLELHGGYGKDGCDCGVCVRFGVGPRATPYEIELMRRAFVMGDDYIAPCRHAELFNAILDFKFGTTTKTQVKKFFSTPGLHEPEGAEFLKKHFYLDRSMETYNVRSFRAPERLLAKLYHGAAATSVSRFYAALLSAVWETGYNPPLQDILAAMISKIRELSEEDALDWQKHLELYVKKSPGLANVPSMYVPTMYDVCNLDASVMKPIMKVKQSRRAEEAKTKVTWY